MPRLWLIADVLKLTYGGVSIGLAPEEYPLLS